MYDVGGKVLNGIKSMLSVGVKGSESKCFRIDSGARKGSIKSGREWRLEVAGAIRSMVDVRGL